MLGKFEVGRIIPSHDVGQIGVSYGRLRAKCQRVVGVIGGQAKGQIGADGEFAGHVFMRRMHVDAIVAVVEVHLQELSGRKVGGQ